MADLFRDAALFVVAGLGLLGPEALPPPDLALAAMAGLAGAVLPAAFDDIVDLFGRNP